MDFSRSKSAIRLLQDGQWMPARINWGERQVIFRKIDHEAFTAVPFHDGRYDFMDNPVERVKFETLLGFTRDAASPEPDRFILHSAFCGSTFLSRLLSVSGKTACYREPQILIDLSTGSQDPQAKDINAAIIAQFRHAPSQGVTSFVKPSNWANSYLLSRGALTSARCVIITIDLESFLIANLRGGHARLKYSLNLLNHVISFAPQHLSHVQDAKALLSRAPMLATLRLLAVLHTLQAKRFEAALALSEGRAKAVSHRDIQFRPIGTAQAASDWLQLGLSPADIAEQYDLHSNQHAKSLLPQPFSKQKEINANTALMAQFSDDILKTMEWAEGTLQKTRAG